MHKLVFPFNQDMYDAGLVVRMTRTALVDYVRCAAEDADVQPGVLEDLVDSVSKKDVATVAVGAFRRSTIPDCYCPAMRAGYIVTASPAVTMHEACGFETDLLIKNFTFHFDAMIWRLNGNRVMAIEVANDAS